MNSIKQVYVIAAPPEDVWQALTDPELITEWSGAGAEFPLERDAEYSLWDGDIRGRIIEFAPNERLVQTWEPESWTRKDSVVTFTLVPLGDGTQVELVHQNVEDWDYEDTSAGWDAFYLGALKLMLESRAAEPAKPAKRSKPKKAPAKKQAAAKKAKPQARKAAPKKKPAKKSPAKRKR